MALQKQKHQYSHHNPVLLEPVLAQLSPQPGERYLDLTAGYGGHASAVISATQSPNLAVLVDRDPNAIRELKMLDFGTKGEPTLVNKSFLEAAEDLKQKGQRFNLILMDLGVSSPQLDIAERGFSFKNDGPLDMRMDERLAVTAADIVNTYTEEELAQTIKTYGEEPRAKAVAKAIVDARPLSSTKELAEVVAKSLRRPRGKTHPATRTFQALRIVVNDELAQLERTLPILLELLEEGGRVAIITFHSLEDRTVKQFFKEASSYGYEATLELLTKKPIQGANDDVLNPRARSAKLRAAAKINTHPNERRR